MRSRYIFRGTQIYVSALFRALDPRYLCHGVRFSVELDALSRTLLEFDTKPWCWPLLAAEKRALSRGDVPLFEADIDGRALYDEHGEVLRDFASESAIERFERRLATLSDTDLETQLGYIDAAWNAHSAHRRSDLGSSLSAEPTHQAPQQLPDCELLAEAEEIASRLLARSRAGADGSRSWIALHYLSHADRYRVAPIDEFLYAGHSGIALFFAALARLTSRGEYEDSARSCLKSALWIVSLPSAKFARAMRKRAGLGGIAGLSGLLYASGQAAELLNDSELRTLSHEGAERMLALLPGGAELDVIGGQAATIQLLVALYENTIETRWLHAAQRMAETVLQAQDRVSGGWPSHTGEILGGYAHGAAGIADALLRLYAVTRREEYRDAAERGLKYQNSLASANGPGWSDLRTGKIGGEPLAGWCNGAAGIGTPFLRAQSICAQDWSARGVTHAVQATISIPCEVDTACCGEAGCIDFLLECARCSGDESLQAVARNRAATVIARARQTGSYRCSHRSDTDTFHPAFFQGLAGIGYTWLRILAPNLLPNVLAMQGIR